MTKIITLHVEKLMRENAKANAEMNRELRRLKGMKATPEQLGKCQWMNMQRCMNDLIDYQI